jgi:hypothetical protein
VVLLVDLAPVRNARNGHRSGRVVEDVNHPVVADSNTPVILVAFQFLASTGTRFARESHNLRVYSGEKTNSFAADGLSSSVYLGTLAGKL